MPPTLLNLESTDVIRQSSTLAGNGDSMYSIICDRCSLLYGDITTEVLGH